jgi:hypothetical protein
MRWTPPLWLSAFLLLPSRLFPEASPVKKLGSLSNPAHGSYSSPWKCWTCKAFCADWTVRWERCILFISLTLSQVAFCHKVSPGTGRVWKHKEIKIPRFSATAAGKGPWDLRRIEGTGGGQLEKGGVYTSVWDPGLTQAVCVWNRLSAFSTVFRTWLPGDHHPGPSLHASEAHTEHIRTAPQRLWKLILKVRPTEDVQDCGLTRTRLSATETKK